MDKLLILAILFSVCACQPNNNTNNKQQLTKSQADISWLSSYISFDAAKFSNPPQKFGSVVRWWWPGNNVSKDELKREVKLFAKKGYAGVEIQPIKFGMDQNAPDSVLKKWYGWDSDAYYKNLRAVMKQAKESGLFVDMTAGSGWPLATPVTSPKDGMQQLTYAYEVVEGGESINIPVPKSLHLAKKPFRTYKKQDFSLAHLQAVVAASIEKKDTQTGQIYLDKRSKKVITDHVTKKRIKWQVPEGGKWSIIAVYSIPTMESNPFAAKKQPLLVVNHWDSTKVQAAYHYLFGARTGLEKYYGDPMRAIFNDSYEFRPTLHFAPNLFKKFKELNGYDLKPWLPQILRINPGGPDGRPHEKSIFLMTDQRKRIKYDFYRTIGDILIQQFIVGSDHWAEQRGMLHRTQAYGPVGFNVIKAAGHADIPGTEQLWDGGSEGFLKLITSGAHLYNRPVVAQESFDFVRRAFMNTPQKFKALSGKAFTAGVNQIVSNGFPYKLKTDRYGMIGWDPFISPYSGGSSNVSTHINESNPFWPDIKHVNTFITRSQYVLRSGKHQADVLIYDPSITSLVGPNPKETIVGGYFQGVEPKARHTNIANPKPKKKDLGFWHVVNKLFSAGITWDYVDDESLRQAVMENHNINIKGNTYKAIILPHIPYATLQAAKEINRLSKKGANIIVVGDIPARQPSFLNYKKRDQKTFQLLKQAVRQSNGHQLISAGLIDKWISRLPQKIQFNKRYNFIRQSVRKLKDGGRLDYLWNMSGQRQTISLRADNNLDNFYWLNPENGAIMDAGNNSNKLKYRIPPYSSIILYAANEVVADTLLSKSPPPVGRANTVAEIKKWDIIIGDTTLTNSSLFNWKNKKEFKYKSAKGIYITTVELNKKRNKQYYIDLGKVYFTAKVWVNGKNAGKCIWSPYTLNITDLLNTGKNKIKIRVVPTLLNKLIGLGKDAQKDEPYSQFKYNKNKLMPAGLVGPVTIKSLKNR